MCESARACACQRQQGLGCAALAGLLAALRVQQAVHLPGCESRQADDSHLRSQPGTWTLVAGLPCWHIRTAEKKAGTEALWCLTAPRYMQALRAAKAHAASGACTRTENAAAHCIPRRRRVTDVQIFKGEPCMTPGTVIFNNGCVQASSIWLQMAGHLKGHSTCRVAEHVRIICKCNY